MSKPLVCKLALLAAALLSAGCAAPPPAPVAGPKLEQPHPAAWRVEPVLAVKSSPEAVKAAQGYYRLGRYYDGMKAWDKSIEAYRKALARDPQHVDARNAMAVVLAQRQQFDQAEALLREAVAAAPGRADLRSNLGYLLFKAGKLDAALAATETALRLEPDNAVAQANRRQAVLAILFAEESARQLAAAAAPETPRPLQPGGKGGARPLDPDPLDLRQRAFSALGQPAAPAPPRVSQSDERPEAGFSAPA